MEVLPITPSEEVAPTASTARFASIHTLYKRVDSLHEVPQGTILIRDDQGLLSEFPHKAVSTADLLSYIEQGWVYVPWDYRFLEFDEIGPEWPKGSRSRCRELAHRRHRHNGARPKVHETDTD